MPPARANIIKHGPSLRDGRGPARGRTACQWYAAMQESSHKHQPALLQRAPNSYANTTFCFCSIVLLYFCTIVLLCHCAMVLFAAVSVAGFKERFAGTGSSAGLQQDSKSVSQAGSVTGYKRMARCRVTCRAWLLGAGLGLGLGGRC